MAAIKNCCTQQMECFIILLSYCGTAHMEYTTTRSATSWLQRLRLGIRSARTRSIPGGLDDLYGYPLQKGGN